MKNRISLIIATLSVLAMFFSCNKAEKLNQDQGALLSLPATQKAPVEKTEEVAVAGPQITFETLEVNFGTIKEGDSFEYDFKFTNTGNADLAITSARGSCGCTVPEWPREPIPSGDTGVIHVKFNSAGKSNNQTKTVTLQTNASPSPITLYIKGFVEVGK